MFFMTMMKCGHAANCMTTPLGGQPVPGCVICSCTEQAPPPDLKGRQARCHCGQLASSEDPTIAFFEFKGPGSFSAIETCKCGFFRCAHEKEEVADQVDPRTVVEKGHCTGFESRGPSEFDAFYCGCDGWD